MDQSFIIVAGGHILTGCLSRAGLHFEVESSITDSRCRAQWFVLACVPG